MPEVVSFDPTTTAHTAVDDALAGTSPAASSPVDAVLAGSSPASPSPIDVALAAPLHAPKKVVPSAALGDTVSFDPSATAHVPAPDSSETVSFTPQDGNHQKVFTAQDVKDAPLDQLDKAKDFEPTDFGLQHEAELNADPALKQKVLEVYRRRSQDFRDLKDLTHDVTSSPLASAGKLIKGGAETFGSVVKGAGQLLSNVNQAANPLVVLPRILGHASVDGLQKGTNEGLNEVAGAAAEIPTSVEANITGLSNLVRKSGREVAEKAAAIDPTGFVRDMTGAKPKSEQTPAEVQARFEDDVAGKKAAVDAVRGQGYLMQSLGLNADELKDAGIIVHPDVVARLQPATDPLNFILLGEGGAVGAVGNVGGRFVVEEIANAATRQEASQFVRALNATAEAAGKVTSTVGQGAEVTGQALGKAGKYLGDLGNVTGIGAIAGGHSTAGWATLFATKILPKTLELAGQGAQKVAPYVAGATRLAADVGIEGAKGFGEGLLLTAPFSIGADPTEREGLLGAAALGGLARGGARAGGLAAKAAATGGQELLSKIIFKEVEQAPKPPAFDYGTNPSLDAAHAAQVAKLPETGQKLVGWLRGLLKDSGIQAYVGDPATFKSNVGTDAAFGSSIRIGQTVDPKGGVKPLVQIFLNGDSTALPHEVLHALEQVGMPGVKEFITGVDKTLTPAERQYFTDIYNTRLNPGKPKSHWTQQLSPEGISTEVAAEVFSRMVLGQDLSGVAAPLVKKAAILVSGFLEKMGVSLGNVREPGTAPGPGRSTLGIRPTAEAAKLGQSFVEKMLSQIQERGNVLPLKPEPLKLTDLNTKSPVGTLTPGEISRVKPSATPVAPTPVVPPSPVPAPIPAGGVPVTNPPFPSVVKPRNIRTTENQQGDFAAQRHAQTKIDEAKATAAKVGSPDVIQHVDEISKAVETGTPIEIEYQSVKNAGGAEAPSGRGARRTEQENAYIAEAMGVLPADVRELAQKVTVPVRWETVAGKPQLIAMSLDKVIANVHKVITEAADHNVSKLIPYATEAGKLSELGWHEVVHDFQDYADNQANGYRGDGGKLVRPAGDIGVSIPAENPAHNPVQLSEAKANFLNMVQGLNPPLTAREVKGATPGNVKGQIIAEINARTPQKPSVIAPKDINKQTFKTSGRDIMETNPLRNELAAAGVPVRSLIEVTERLSTDNIAKVTPRPDINLKAPVTDVIRGGLLPGGPDFYKQNSVADIGAEILKSSPEEWHKLTSDIGGLTGGAYRLGVNLKDVGDVAKLRDLEAQAIKQYEAAKAAKDFDAMMPAATKKQFFTEAIETATGEKPSKRDTIGRILGPDWKAPFPEAGNTIAGPDASGALPGNQLAKPTAPVGSVGKGFQPPEAPRPDNTALALPVEGVDSPVRYAGEKDGLTPMRFLPGKAPGEDSTPASPSYPDADRLARERGGNAWVRQSSDASNKERVLLVQFTPELMYPNGPDPVSTPYYDKLYSGSRPGYTRATDFWELPQWVAIAADNLGSKADFYAVRNMEEAKKFLTEAEYGHVAFSVMDVSKAVTEELVPHISGQVDLGGYTDRAGAVAKNPNAKVWNSMNEFIESMGVKYEKGFDYRHFRGTEIIPRLELSAGCRHRCTFCTIDRKVTNSPLGEINSQVDSFSDLNAKLVYLNDKTFGQSPNIAEMPRLYKEMKAANPDFEGFVIQTTAAQMKTFTDKFLKDAGIRYVELGVESYNDSILKKLRKPATEKLIDEAVDKLRRNEINFIPNIVIGFPGETAETYARTMAFLDKNSDVVSHLNTYNLAVYEGTEISKEVSVKTAADADENSFSKSFYADPKIHEDFAKSLYDYGTKQLDQKTPFPGELSRGQLLPAGDFARDLDPIKEAAIMTKGGHIVTGSWHGEALDKLVQMAGKGELPEKFRATLNPEQPESAYDHGELTDGFVTASGKFLDRQEAFAHAEAIKQLDKTKVDFSRAEHGTLESTDFKNARTFLPKKNDESKLSPQDIAKKKVVPGAIHAPAVRLDDGTIVTGAIHATAISAALERDPYYQGGFEDGFLTNDGKFLNRKQAQLRAEDIQQIPKGVGLAGALGYLETKEFDKNRRFLPQKKKNMDEEVANTDYSKYNVSEPSKAPAGGLTGWILPNQKFVGLNAAYHEQYLADNAGDLNKRFGTTFTDKSDTEARLEALNNGFVRIRGGFNGSGSLNMELNARYFKNPTKKALEGYLSDRADDIDAMNVSLLNDKGQVVDSGSVKVHELEGADRADALLKTLNGLRPSSMNAKLLPGNPDTLPGLNLPSEEKAQQQRVKARVAASQDKFPEALKLAYQKDDAGKFIVGEDGKPKPQTVEYNLSDSPLEAAAAKGLKGEDRQRALEQALGDKLAVEGKAALKNPEIEAGRKWYSTARTRLKGLFGDDSKFFTELLGATSARTPVEVNYRFALDAYNQFKQGKFDAIIKKYREGKTKWDQRNINDFLKANPENTNPTRGQFLDWWVEKNDLSPTQTNGKKFGANSRQVLRVLDGSWAEEIGGPKTPNFAGNLAGTTFEATIDVWAARTLHRLANEGNPKPWRILPPNETGVVDKDFEIGQAAYRHAAQKLGMKPDALQAVLWFAEKDYWEKKGWTRGAGAEKSDFNVLLKDTEPAGAGMFKMKSPQQDLSFGLNSDDIKKK